VPDSAPDSAVGTLHGAYVLGMTEPEDVEAQGARTRGGYSTGHQLYAVIEFCNSRKALWAKLKTGRWDWLGVKDGRTFVLGSPRVQRRSGVGIAVQHEPGATGVHRVAVEASWVPKRVGPAITKCLTADSARRRFESAVARLEKPDGSSGLWRVRLYVDDRIEDDVFALRLASNYLGGKRRTPLDS